MYSVVYLVIEIAGASARAKGSAAHDTTRVSQHWPLRGMLRDLLKK